MFALHSVLSVFVLPFFLFIAPLFFLCSVLTSVTKDCLSSPNYTRLFSSFSFFFVLPWRFHERTLAIWRWKGWNHLDSCPATEPLKLPDKAVRLHFDSNCQSKLALPFTINKRQHKVLPLPLSEPANGSAFHMHWSVFSQLLFLFVVCLSAFISCSFFTFFLCAFVYCGVNFAEHS